MKILIKKLNLKISVFALLLVMFFCPSQEVFGDGLVFERDLTLGSTGEDVKELQVFLNQDADTRLADSGAGSPGQETEYFGSITKNAVVRFQEKYSSEILAPLGLRRGTGYFGPSSRSKTEELLSEKEPQTENINEGSADEHEDNKKDKEETEEVFNEKPFYPENEDQELTLNRPSKYQGETGSELFLYGQGFAVDNTVHFGDVSIDVKAQSPDTIKMQVPHEVEKGYHEIEVENKFGKAKAESAFFVVTDEDSVPPRIDSVKPQKGDWGTEVTVYGEGFDREWNMLRTPFGIIEGIPSDDGESLTFNVEPYPEAFDPDRADLPERSQLEGVNMLDKNGEEITGLEIIPKEWEMRFYLVNDDGVSEDPGVFILNLNFEL